MVEGFIPLVRRTFPFTSQTIHVHSSFTLRCALPHGNRSLLVVCASGVHPVPSRTRSLSLTAPMVLGGTPPGRVGHRQRFCCFTRCMLHPQQPHQPPAQASNCPSGRLAFKPSARPNTAVCTGLRKNRARAGTSGPGPVFSIRVRQSISSEPFAMSVTSDGHGSHPE